MKTWLRGMLPVGAALIVLVTGCGGGSTPAGDGAPGDTPATAGSGKTEDKRRSYPLHFRESFPDLSVYALDGTQVRTGSLIEERESVVILLSTSCSVCADLIELWRDLEHQIPDTLNVVAIVDEDLDYAREWAKQEQFPFPLYVDSKSAFKRRHEIVQLPTAVGVAADGTILYVRRGVSEMFTPPRAADLLRRGGEELRKRQLEEAESDG